MGVKNSCVLRQWFGKSSLCEAPTRCCFETNLKNWNYVGLVDTYRLGADIAPERSPLHAENQATISPGIQG